jgi:diaminopimelate decarboxylase
LHVVFPNQARRNAENWFEELKEIYGSIDIKFGLKACKSAALTSAVGWAGIGADASSAEEIMAALAACIPGSAISLTGPHKPDRELRLAIAHGVCVHLDSQSELDRYRQLALQSDTRKIFSFRYRPASERKSRFGMTGSEILDCTDRAVSWGMTEFGLSFHLNNYDIAARRTAIAECIDLVRRIIDRGGKVSFIDVGGGYPLTYMSDFDPEAYRTAEHWLQQKGALYPYAATPAAAAHAAEVLRGEAGGGQVDFLRRHGIRMVFQPGRALIDQCGISLFRVIGTKPHDADARIATLDGMSFSLSEMWFGSDFAPDPVILKGGRPFRTDSGPNRYFLMGRSCLESDVIRSRALRSPVELEAGDVVCFLNTAGYQMDSNESPFHRMPLPRKVAAYQRDDVWQVCLDDGKTIQGCEA